jgi:hypothetical protein
MRDGRRKDYQLAGFCAATLPLAGLFPDSGGTIIQFCARPSELNSPISILYTEILHDF